MACFKILYQYPPGQTKKNHKNQQSWQPVTKLSFKPATPWIQV